MPSPSAKTTGDIMILDYPWVEIYLPETIKEVTEKSISRNRRQIIRDFEEECGEINCHPVTLIALWDTALEGKEYRKQHVEGVISLTELLIWEQNNQGIQANNKRIKVIKPEHIREELVRRNLEWFDVYEAETRDNFSFNDKTIRAIFTNHKKQKPSYELICFLTKYIIEFDNKLLELPKDKGVRWDIDEWRRTSSIKVKQSWEEERD